MITYPVFEEAITKIMHYCNAADQIASIRTAYGYESASPAGFVLVDQIVKLLEISTGDKDEWISWWCFEKDFGRYDDLVAYDENKNVIPTSTIQDLYNLVCGGDHIAD